MSNFKIVLKKILISIYLRINFFILLISTISILFIFFKQININLILGISKNLILEFIFQSFVNFSTIFTILFLPTYPIFCFLLNKKPFNLLERISITIVINSVFYILGGYIFYWIGISLTGFSFLIVVVISYVLIIIYTIFIEFNKGSLHLIKLRDSSIESLYNISIFKYLKNKLSINGLLLIIFLFLICIVNIVKTSYFVGTDPWLHILNSKIITDLNVLPFESYHGELGLHIFGAIIHFFSGISHILIPKYFIFYNFFISALIYYNLLMRIFRNHNLALFGVFILEFSSLGFSTMMLQYWPSGSALIKCLLVFFLLYSRLQNFLQIESPTRKIIFSDIILTYFLSTVIFIGAVLTHVITSLIFLIIFLWLYLVYFFRDYKRGVDFIFLCLLMGIFIILNVLGIGTGHYWFLIPLNFSWYYLLIFGVFGIILGGFIIWKLAKSINFSKGRFKSTIFGEDNKLYQKIEDKFIFHFLFIILIITLMITIIMNMMVFNLSIINIFYVCEIILFISFAIWGLILFQKKPRGKPIFIWALGFLILLAAGFLFNMFLLSNMIWQRILYLIPPVIVIGFVSYIYKLIKLGRIEKLRMKSLILSVITFSLLTTYLYESVSFEIFTLNRREVNAFQWYSNNTSIKNVIFTEFGRNHVLKYYDYVYNDINATFDYGYNFYYLKYKSDLFPPNNHFNESGNILKLLKDEYNTDLYIIFAGEYIINKGDELFGHLTEDELNIYNNLNYLNKIFSSKSKKGNEIPIFWVI